MRNKKRFPEDFAFRMTKGEWENLKCQFGISSSRWGGRRSLLIFFTEHGVAMAAILLKSDLAIHISVEIVRVFIKMRNFLNSQKEFSKELQELKTFALKHSNQTDREFRRVWQAIERLSKQPEQEERRIGFRLN